MKRCIALLALACGFYLACPSQNTLASAAPATTGQTGTLQNTGDSSTSPQTLGILQPASSSSTGLQSADATTGGVAQSGMQNLQQSGSSDQLKLLIQGEGDQPHQISAGPDLSWMLYLLGVLLVATVGTGAIVVLQQRRIL